VSVLPMQAPQPVRPWLIEICPASTLKRLGLREPYKGRTLAETRAQLLSAVASTLSLSIPEPIRALATAEPEGDALDSIIAAAATFHALQGGSLTTPADGTSPIEGLVYF